MQSIQSPFAATMIQTISEENAINFKIMEEVFSAALVIPDALDVIK